MSRWVSQTEYQRVCEERDELRERLALALRVQVEDEQAWRLFRLRDRLGLRDSGAHLMLALYEAAPRSVSTTFLESRLPCRDHARDRNPEIVKVQIRYVRVRLGMETIETVLNSPSPRHGGMYRLGAIGKELIEEALAA
jgi:hypothetical protein